MKYILTVTTSFLLLLLATPPVLAQDAFFQWDDLNQEALKLHGAGEYDAPK